MNTADHPPLVMTVLGSVQPGMLGVCDAHNHLWIQAVPGGAPDAPVLAEEQLVLDGLRAYREAGGASLLDCQPGRECGRDARALVRISQASGVQVVSCTGFHRRRYYPPCCTLWEMPADALARHFLDELAFGTLETRGALHPVRAGYVKAAIESRLEDTPQAALEGALSAARERGAALMVHTEKGSQAERLVAFCAARGLPPARLVLFHIDKRPDFGLHRELAEAGVLLEYDTFYRPQYDPETHLWPLIRRMAAADLAHAVALGTDMAAPEMWASPPGLPGLLTVIRPRLQAEGLPAAAVEAMCGGNIARRLAMPAM